MNRVILTGRLTADPTISYTTDNKAIARFNLAVDRKFKREGDANADFPSCTAFGKTAEFIEKYFSKGMKMELEGRLQTGSYEKDGKKVYTTTVIADEVGFAESKNANTKEKADEGFMDIPDDSEELPFA